jgi:hypothetical protein
MTFWRSCSAIRVGEGVLAAHRSGRSPEFNISSARSTSPSRTAFESANEDVTLVAEPVILLQRDKATAQRVGFGRGVSDIAQNRPWLDGRKLVAVAEENHAGLFR